MHSRCVDGLRVRCWRARCWHVERRRRPRTRRDAAARVPDATGRRWSATASRRGSAIASIFSMPTGAAAESAAAPGQSAGRSRSTGTGPTATPRPRAPSHYVEDPGRKRLRGAVERAWPQALNEVAPTDRPAQRLAIVERARKTLADWPPTHYNYRAAEVRQMLGMLDEAIADLRAATGARPLRR